MKTEEDPVLELSQAHLSFLLKSKRFFLPQSRQICKTKKKIDHKKSYYKAADKKMSTVQDGFSKKLDQKMYKKFCKLSKQEQQVQELTPESIRRVAVSKNPKSKNIIKKLQKKVKKDLKWIQLMTDFAHSK